MEKEWLMQRLDELRQERGWSKCKLNEEAGFSTGMIYQYYNTDRMPTIQNVEMICNACNITLSEFFANGVRETEQVINFEFNNLYLQLTLAEKEFMKEMVRNLLALKKNDGNYCESNIG